LFFFLATLCSRLAFHGHVGCPQIYKPAVKKLTVFRPYAKIHLEKPACP
jgi:hypothetical protein